MMGETAGLQFTIDIAEIICHLSRIPIRELKLLTAFVTALEGKPKEIHRCLCYIQVYLDIVSLLTISFDFYVC